MSLIFLWENFGPMHADRCEAVAATGVPVIGLEMYGGSETYDWEPAEGKGFEKITLFPHSQPHGLPMLWALLRFRMGLKRRLGARPTWFLCHYERVEILIFAMALRLMGDRVFTMGCAKFDDQKRRVFREWLKSWFFLPYQGAIGSALRARDYFRFLGFRSDRVTSGYNTLSIARIRTLSGSAPAPDGMPFAERHFTVVARLVPKKNLFMMLEAYARYASSVPAPRMLHLCGNGPLENELKTRAMALGIADQVVFHGFVQSDAIARLLAKTLVLLLPSIEEQFGNVVIEAQAMGLPVILSYNCGARDILVRSGVNGFVIEPDNPEGVAWFMEKLCADEALWRRMALAAQGFAPRGDAAVFARGVAELAG